MKKIIFGLVAIGIIGTGIFIGCTKKSNEVVPLPATNKVEVGNLRISLNENELTVTEKTDVGSDGSIASISINSKGIVSISKIEVAASNSGNNISRITVTPSEKIALAANGGGCPTLSEIETIARSSAYTVSQSDICKIIDFVKCAIQNPGQYGLTQSDVSNISQGSINQFCKSINCPSCSALSSSTPVAQSIFTFDGTDYTGTASCSESSGSSGSSSYSITSGSNSFSYYSSKSGSSLSVRIGDKSYYSSGSSSEITFESNGNTKTISGNVKLSSTSTSSTPKSVSATVVCN